MDEYLKRWEIYAPKSYAQIRETDDIDQIAQNTKLPIRKIRKIKEHLFINQHQLDDGVRLFDPDPVLLMLGLDYNAEILLLKIYNYWSMSILRLVLKEFFKQIIVLHIMQRFAPEGFGILFNLL
ncbi:hypothetical protein [Aphanothece hegewaldii]|uniref:hypothetical protein n=1 Tax=Aphanothece hegewaldii TaxID=1521625 RepID=UPI001C62A264|nr:hypothetical protein [Aphanothece hegewaldii]